jgi:hypothetical protein
MPIAACSEESYPDRRVRQTGREARRDPVGRCGGGGANSTAANSDTATQIMRHATTPPLTGSFVLRLRHVPSDQWHG